MIPSRRLPIIAAVALALLTAGCFGGSGKGDGPDPTDLSPTETSSGVEPGTIEGTVVDDSQLPVAGAQVGFQGLDRQAMTGESGAFSFDGLEPGTYQLVAGKLGYESVGRSVAVKPGETTTVTLVIALVPIVEAYNETFVYEGRMTCGILLVPWCGSLQDDDPATPNPTNDAFYFQWDWPEGEYPVTQVLELEWTPTTGTTGQTLEVLYYTSGPGATDTHVIAEGAGSSPIRIIVNQKALEGAKAAYPSSNFTYGVYPALDELTLDQGYTLYRTDFYGDPAPDGFTALDTDE